MKFRKAIVRQILTLKKKELLLVLRLGNNVCCITWLAQTDTTTKNEP